MNTTALNQTIGQMVAEHPDFARLFEKLGIDYCCGGKVPFAEACAAKHLDAQTVLRMLDLNPLLSSFSHGEKKWDTSGLSELCNHIETTHHAYLKTELPRLSQIANKVASVHGEKDPALIDLARVFEAFQSELTEHMQKEEQILFPLCRELESSKVRPVIHCGSVKNPVAVMEREHTDAGDALAEMRRLTHDFTPPDWACNTYRVLLQSLAELEKDMHVHVHKENSILFPKAVAREAKLCAA